MDQVTFLDLPGCYRLSNDDAEVILSAAAGPRILRYALAGGANMLGEHPAAAVTTPWGPWRPLGGHRLWAAPEVLPRTYAPDNDPVAVEVLGERSVRLRQTVDQSGLEKWIAVTLATSGTAVLVEHSITNRALWPITLAPWALTIMRGGGSALIPQAPYRSHDDDLLPARPLVMWSFTDLSDRRWTLGPRFIRLRCDPALSAPQKLGVGNEQGWCAYHHAGTLFVKQFPYIAGAAYPDYGCNTETYTAGDFVEIESLGALVTLEPGQSVAHTERWALFDGVELAADDAALAAALAPLVAATAAATPQP